MATCDNHSGFQLQITHTHSELCWWEHQITANRQALQLYFWDVTVYEIIVMLWNMEI